MVRRNEKDWEQRKEQAIESLDKAIAEQTVAFQAMIDAQNAENAEAESVATKEYERISARVDASQGVLDAILAEDGQFV